jgi:lipopolysaccharide transport system permease protein
MPLEVPAISSMITSIIMLSFEMMAFAIFMVVFNFIPPIGIAWLPLLILLESVLVLGLALPMSVMNVFYRDLQYIWGVILQAGFFLTPIAYHFDLFPKEIRPFLYLNPVAGLIDLGHSIVLGMPFSSDYALPYIIGIPFVTLIVGYVVFVRLSSRVVDEL